MADAVKTTGTAPRGWDRPIAEVNAVIRKAEGGDGPALAEVREMLARPGTINQFRGNVAREVLLLLVKSYAGNNAVVREATIEKLVELRAELSGSAPTALEKLLVERVLATWLHLHTLEAAYAGKESLSLAQGAYYQKVISAAQKRYLAAIKGLAEVRKFALPALQVNIAKKQINVSGTVPAVN